MKRIRFSFLAFAISMILFCSISHEVFPGKAPPESVFQTEYNDIFSVPGYSTDLNVVQDVDLAYRYAAVEEAHIYSMPASIAFNYNYILNQESPVTSNSSGVLFSNETGNDLYAASTRKIVIKNSENFNYNYNASNKILIRTMQYRASLWV